MQRNGNQRSRIRRAAVATAAAAAVMGSFLLVAQTAPQSREIVFVPRKIDGPVHDPANFSYWYGPFSECASVADFNRDGKLDIAAGRHLYLAPDWRKISDFRDGAETNGPETDNNSEFAMDVNQDGWPDVVSSGWMRMRGVYWYENPGKEWFASGDKTRWKAHRIHSALSLEGVIHGNIAGRGDHDILVNHWALVKGQGLTWLEHLDRAPWFREHVLGPEGEGHGNGLGDINGDGRNDIVTPTGWWENPPRAAEDKWIWHPDYKFEGGPASHPILVYDVNGDGWNDIIIGASHTYGLAWLEQSVSGGKRTFTHHWLDTDFGGFHTMAMGDLDGDGRPDLVTGKRLFPHHGRDIGEFDPLFLFWYRIHPGGRWERHPLSYSHLPWYPTVDTGNPPPNYAIGAGMKLNVADMDGDGRLDVVATGKSGLYILYNKGYPSKKREKNLLPDELNYPSWIPWDTSRAQPGVQGFVSLFNSKDLSGWQRAAHWTVEDGVIALKNRTDRQEHNDNYLWSEKQYGDFVLDLEFKAIEGTNSGIFLRTSDMKDPVQTGIEVQVAWYASGRPASKGSLGGLYDLVAPGWIPFRANDWNRYTILCRGSQVTVLLNGEMTAEADLNQWTEARKNPDGTANKFTRPLKDFARRGYIGLQDHGTPVWYRNIRIRTLD
ncbi:MAG: DUF1080 domain-containing protein [Bryobacteraceae bacterium]|nr:DUF1080 domain-containing protein [Bryobacteraceae bacterium]